MRPLMLILVFAAALLGQGGGGVQFRDWNPPPAAAKPVTTCSQLLSLTDFELSVISAALVSPTAGAPEHCHIFLMAQPEMNIEVNLPTDWNGRFYMFGNGGWAGESFDAPGRVANHARALRAGFATASTDTGHSAALEPNASFAPNRQKLLDYGFRSLHVTALAAKRFVHIYYGANASKSYYDGCSQGGRQALTIAQRFPDDFDGIIAGSPALYNTGNMLARAYWMRGLSANPFPAAKLGLLAGRVYDKCDAKDGLKDGLIEDPLHCGFQATQDLPRCAEGKDQPDCFTASEIAAADRIYSDIPRQANVSFPGGPWARKFSDRTARAAGWARRSPHQAAAVCGGIMLRAFSVTWRRRTPILADRSRISTSTKTFRAWHSCMRPSMPPTPIFLYFTSGAASSSCISAGPILNSIRVWRSSITNTWRIGWVIPRPISFASSWCPACSTAAAE
jgi:Tannase and feruloyl esterase